jgi:hypothetical protein
MRVRRGMDELAVLSPECGDCGSDIADLRGHFGGSGMAGALVADRARESDMGSVPGPPKGEAEGRDELGADPGFAHAEAIADLVLRLARVLNADYDFVQRWLRSPIAALAGEVPLVLLSRGEIERVARVVSSLEDPGAV